MTLTLRRPGRFLGMYPYFDNDGNLVLRFNNPPPASGKNLAGARIVIDPGHGVGDSGALGFLSAYPERTINYGVASRLANLLAARGASVTFINSKKPAFSLEQRVTIAAEADPQLFISVHANSSAYNHSATGTEAYYFTPYSAAMAKYAAATVGRAQHHQPRIYIRPILCDINPQYPSILVETGFVSNEAVNTENSSTTAIEQHRQCSGRRGLLVLFLYG
jgi:N-acetylmuramoyl-L-alanine amidase